MASTSISSGVHGVAPQSTSCKQFDWSCSKRKRLHSTRSISLYARLLHQGCTWQLQKYSHTDPLLSFRAVSGEDQPSGDDDKENDPSANDEFSDVEGKLFREKLENMIGSNDAAFCGKDLAMLIRNKYGRSYDVQLIKREFMGRQLLAMNVMWKYREQRSFPLTEEEYLLRLDDVANNLKCWGAVSYVRNSLAKTKERPRIGKAVSIFIDLDESGGRANEWIYR